MPSLRCSRFRSQEKGVLCPFSHIQNSISIFLFFAEGCGTLAFPLFWLIRICWLNVNGINPSWWHWIRLLFEYSAYARLIDYTDSILHLAQHKCLSPLPIFVLISQKQVLFFSKAQKYDLNYSVFYLFGGGFGVNLLLTPTCGCLECPLFPPTSPLWFSCRQWILIEARLSDNL